VTDYIAGNLRAYAEKDGRGYPDWAVRYVPLVRGLRKRGARFDRVLEIGANENGLARFADTNVIAVDVNMRSLRAARDTQRVQPVAADMAALPFRDNTFDICVSVDTFEHANDETRRRALVEMLRVLVLTGVGAVTFPSGDAAARAEERIRHAYRQYTAAEIRWLEEHLEHGLPEAEEMEQLARRLAGDARPIRREKNANVRAWSWMWRVLMCGWPGRGNALCQVILRWMTPFLTRAHFGTCYRTIVWLEPTDE